MKEELIKAWVEARGNTEYYWEKYETALFGRDNYYAEHSRWATKAKILKEELDKLT